MTEIGAWRSNGKEQQHVLSEHFERITILEGLRGDLARNVDAPHPVSPMSSDKFVTDVIGRSVSGRFAGHSTWRDRTLRPARQLS